MEQHLCQKNMANAVFEKYGLILDVSGIQLPGIAQVQLQLKKARSFSSVFSGLLYVAWRAGGFAAAKTIHGSTCCLLMRPTSFNFVKFFVTPKSSVRVGEGIQLGQTHLIGNGDRDATIATATIC